MSNESIWTSKMMMRLLEMKTARDMSGEPSESEMAEILSEEFGIQVTKNAVHGKIWRELKDVVLEPENVVFMPMYERYRDTIHDSSISNQLNSVDLSGRKQILHIADIHIPFENREALYGALNLNAAADMVITSEVMDVSSQSSFGGGARVPLEQEIESTLRFLEFMSERFPLTIIVESNHEHRIKRSITRNLPPELGFMVQEDNILELLSRPFPNVFVIPHWWIQLGDAIFCHAFKNSSILMRAGTDIDDHFKKNTALYGLNPYHLIVQAHTHFLGAVYRPQLKIIEAGCACLLLEWVMQKPTKNTWQTGYVTVVMDDGKVDLERSREHALPNKLQSKKGLVF